MRKKLDSERYRQAVAWSEEGDHSISDIGLNFAVSGFKVSLDLERGGLDLEAPSMTKDKPGNKFFYPLEIPETVTVVEAVFSRLPNGYTEKISRNESQVPTDEAMDALAAYEADHRARGFIIASRGIGYITTGNDDFIELMEIKEFM